MTGDDIRELGRLAEGSIEMIETTHRNPRSAGTDFSLRPSSNAVAAGEDGVERDASHDGLYDSAGCTTLHPDDYSRFESAVTANAAQSTWQYVLTATAP